MTILIICRLQKSTDPEVTGEERQMFNISLMFTKNVMSTCCFPLTSVRQCSAY